MKLLFATATIAATAVAGALAQACAAGSAYNQNGNWYCEPVSAISYTNFGTPGQYNKVTNFNVNTGKCSSESTDYAGGISPMDEEVSTWSSPTFWIQKLTTNLGLMALSRSSLPQAVRLLYTRHTFKDQTRDCSREATCAQAQTCQRGQRS
jgi:hypothetical protein